MCVCVCVCVCGVCVCVCVCGVHVCVCVCMCVCVFVNMGLYNICRRIILCTNGTVTIIFATQSQADPASLLGSKLSSYSSCREPQCRGQSESNQDEELHCALDFNCVNIMQFDVK